MLMNPLGRARFPDGLFVSILVLIAQIGPVASLGLYGDDWDVFWLFARSGQDSIRGLYEAIYEFQRKYF